MEDIINVNVAGGSRGGVTSELEKFDIDKLVGTSLNLDIFDVPGVEERNYLAQEIALLCHGIMPYRIPFKSNEITYDAIGARRDTPEEEAARIPHVFAFFVPQGCVILEDVMQRLANLYREITVVHSMSCF